MQSWKSCRRVSLSFSFHDLRHGSQANDCSRARLPIIAKVDRWGLSTVVDMAERHGHFEWRRTAPRIVVGMIADKLMVGSEDDAGLSILRDTLVRDEIAPWRHRNAFEPSSDSSFPMSSLRETVLPIFFGLDCTACNSQFGHYFLNVNTR